MENNNRKGFVARCKDFFGFLPGEHVQAFGAELKALTEADKLDLWAQFNAMGLPTDPPTAPPASK